MSEREYRTLMLEPQWHPIKWIKKHISADDWAGFLLAWDLAVPLLVSVPHPKHMGSWPWWRMTMFVLGFAPLIIGLLACAACGFMVMALGLMWLYHHPPFKVKTRYQSKRL